MRPKILFKAKWYSHKHSRRQVWVSRQRGIERVQNLWQSLSSFYMCLRVECPFYLPLPCNIVHYTAEMMYTGWINFMLLFVVVLCWTTRASESRSEETNQLMMVFHLIANENRWNEKTQFESNLSLSLSHSHTHLINMFCWWDNEIVVMIVVMWLHCLYQKIRPIQNLLFPFHYPFYSLSLLHTT